MCKTWDDYIEDLNGCRSNGGVDRLTTKQLSCVPFIGLSSFYKGNTFDGCCEVINAVMTVIAILTPFCYPRRTTDGIGVCISVVTVVLDLVKIVHMITIRSVDGWEIFVMVVTLVLFNLYCWYVDTTHVRVYVIIPALLITFATGTIETFRDFYTAAHDDRDGSDCPFI